MSNFSKLFAAILGPILGYLVAMGLLPAEWATADIQAAIMTLFAAIAVYFSPANKPT